MDVRRVIQIVLLTVLACLCSCDSEPTASVEVKNVDAAGKEFVDTVPTMPRLFQQKNAASTPGFRIEIFVDQSASMEGYVDYEHNWPKSVATSAYGVPPMRGGSEVERSRTRQAVAPATAAQIQPSSSAFVRLLREFANEEELIGYFGFGSDGTAAQTIVPYGKTAPLDPKRYTRTNNDYADLLQQFVSRPTTSDGLPIERVIITDGVQSHRDLGVGSALSQTVQKLHDWIGRGGVVEVRLLSAPFAGTYYSEELRARQKPVSFSGRVPDRPFIMISLLSSPADLPAWDAFWKRNAMSGIATVATLRCPTEAPPRPVSLTPEERIPKDVAVDVLNRNVWELSRVVTLDGYRNLWRANVRRIRTQENAEPSTYPACFLLKGITASADEAGAEAEFRQMRPVIEVWRGPAPRHGGDAKKPSPTAGDKDWNRIAAVDLRDFHNGQVKMTRVNDAPDTFRLTANLPTPQRNVVQAAVLTVTPPAAIPPPPDWKGSSTLDDSSVNDLNKIYNLQPFVEQLTEHTTRDPDPVGLLLLTYR